jgi:NO-binding membrane sensor protein with MHYT domain
MGAISIWSMHFIGNNSMTLTVQDNSYQLSYNAGYTFASLVVAIACMFLAFTFVGITEEAKVSRIIPSGIFTGVRRKKKIYNYIIILLLIIPLIFL